MMKKAPHTLKFLPCVGKAGDIVTLSQQCEYLFRGTGMVITEKLIDGRTPLHAIGTSLLGAKVNGKDQFPSNEGGIPSIVFGPTAQNNELLLDALKIGEPFEIQLKFLLDCEVSIEVRGQVAVEEPK